MSEWATAAETDADEKALLAQVMALSQQEFLDSLKRHSKEGRDGVGDGSEKAGSSNANERHAEVLTMTVYAQIIIIISSGAEMSTVESAVQK
ncbi:unnamed protein product [Toxocara canis]|uniref:Importin subunit beta-1 n=1 Tax=Toxocara canis TaxID=6265 RepID=A0A183VEP2_TOXCA|nr:unnamed protein product [Toxocara canis]